MSWVIEYNLEGNTAKFDIKNGISTIGRAKCDLCVDDVKVSRHHCSLYLHNGVLSVIDKASSNGTFVNGRRVDKWELSDQDEIIIGTTVLRLVHY
ncbi:MAG: FHA domain-containing protein [Oligoflexia bacterium]|nr:FHA domain-containing protein [Oligoflexia bacterium]